ncbi:MULTISPECIES: ABC transporter ATP-binding protein [unclassified Chelatococcus]|uniref:ABC transporter ATP-binding protein n=1 Tax=unclassified Chelatococcus TaxID=2638111 RepID=UPI001BCBF558|nr:MULTISPECIES: ABC transporter ATP-binding protein [unclassified Chelatococcus]CAH1648275.1 branched chain amino acid/phenylalanine ABC transporter ATP binding subunit LivG [Hyphomicrobiales bacterium]MBS7742012.1 ABC transporter ATP-binding protein [Chelatococcus sp. HY11]MBX3541190.1 ABC transporter ATP-binding protein [Chelatococcus sp.]MCO5074917.1 ABC transporter ATP-binding protein [Chelatococcus sp.]CAH1690658.1 branched chain amino acid/phenylalanine ABC transporter ATP binding subun
MSPLLEVQGLTRRFGGLTAVSDVSFSVSEGEIFGVIGPNGAGKTTLFNVIAGHYKPSAGTATFSGRGISGRRSDVIARLGIARTFQAVHLFAGETVAENLRRARVLSTSHGPFAYLRSFGTGRTEPHPQDVATFVGLGNLLDQTAGGLAYGLQKMLGIGMALMVSPKLLLMDEPAAGLNPSEKRAASALIRRLRDERGISILLVEHDMPLVMGVCDRILVVNQGKPIAIGSPDAIKADPAVIDAYLGDDYEFA